LNLLRKKPLSLCLFAALCGCAAGPDFKRPDAPAASAYTSPAVTLQTASSSVLHGESQKFVAAQDIPFEWWTLFKSPQLDALIKRTFKANPNIEAAQAAVRQAQEYATAQNGYFYPTVTASYSPSRNKLAGNMGGNSPGQQGNGTVIQTYSNPAGPKYNSPAYYNFHVAQLTVGYVPDVFGVNRRKSESLQAQVDAQRMQLEATYITLASNVVAAAIQEAALRAQISALSEIVSLNEEALKIMRKRLELGDVGAMDVAQQESNLALAQQSLIPLQQQLQQTRNLLHVLTGNTPDAELPETFTLESLHLPQELPLSLPSKLVEQRPDVRIAEAQ
jgi:NodT family efflux transporter outer membrane factor (OMF) lipoprotein